MSFRPIFPKDPVDGFTLTWWRISEGGGMQLYVTELRAVYHVDSPFPLERQLHQDRPYPRLTDQWLIYENDHTAGRAEGWMSYARPGEFDGQERVFHTELEAVQGAIGWLAQVRHHKERELRTIHEVVGSLMDRQYDVRKRARGTPS